MVNNVTLRGAGADQTFLTFSGSIGCGYNVDVCFSGSTQNAVGGSGTTVNWTAGYAQGTTSITLSATTGLSVGSVMMLYQADTTTTIATGDIVECGTATTCSEEGPSGGQVSGNSELQFVQVTNIAGTTVTFTPPLAMPNYSSAKSPKAWWANGQLVGAGLEDLSMDHSGSGAQAGSVFFNAAHNWVKGVSDLHTDRSHFWIVFGFGNMFVNNYMFGTKNGSSQSYGFECYLGSDNVFQNNIEQQIVSPLEQNGGCERNVYAYNFAINDLYTASSNYLMAQIWLHAAGVDKNLYEGNEGPAFFSDVIHGSHNFNTAFRSFWSGSTQGKTTQLNPQITRPLGRFANYIGNVFGSPNQTIYQVTSTTGEPPWPIYELGCCDGIVASDPFVLSTLMRWGNYDTVTGTSRFVNTEVPTTSTFYPNGVPASQTLPASFYLSSKPAWWGTMPWPAIGPDVNGGDIQRCTSGPFNTSLVLSSGACGTGSSSTTAAGGHAYGIPAMSCYFNHMNGPPDGSGSPLAFNESACYSVAAGPAFSVAPTSYNFGSLTVNQSAATTFVVTNAGTGSLTFSAVTISGNAFFTKTSDTCNGQSIAAGATCNVQVTFHPTSTGTGLTATVTFTDNASGSPHTISVSGTAVTAAPVVNLASTSITFPDTVQGQTATAITDKLTNTGTATLTLSVGTTGDFAESDDCGASLAAGSFCTLSLTFTPTATGNRSGVATITSNAGSSPDTIQLAGNGISAGTAAVSLSPGGTPQAVQHNFSHLNLSTTPCSVSLAGAVAGDSILLSVTTGNSRTISGISDGGDTFVITPNSPATNGVDRLYLAYALAVTAGAKTISISFAGGSSYADCWALETSPLASLRTDAPGNGTASSVTVPTLAVTLNDFLYATTEPSSGNVTGVGSGWSLGTLSSSTGAADEYQVASSSATIGPNFTLSGSASFASMFADFAPATSLSFGQQALGTASPAQQITLKNTGTAALTVTGVSIGGANSGDYAQTNGCIGTVAAGSTCSISVTFTPAGTNTRTAFVSIADSVGTQTVNLTGVGFTAPTINLGASVINFGNQQQNTTSQTQSVLLTNTGGSSLTITSVALTSGVNFGVTTDCPLSPSTLGAGANCHVSSTFTPTTTGILSDTVTIRSNASNDPQTLPVSGNGVSPQTSPAVSITPTTSIGFSTTSVGGTSSPIVVTVTNTGSGVLSSLSIAVSLPFHQAATTCGTSLAASGSCTVTVNFQPTAAGSSSGTITITDNAADSPQIVHMTGATAGLGITPKGSIRISGGVTLK